MNFEDAAPKFAALPKSWHPRREQPEWDRDFSGRIDINTNAVGKTDKMKTHVMEAVAFSEIIKGGYTEQELRDADVAARHFIAKEMRKNGKS